MKSRLIAAIAATAIAFTAATAAPAFADSKTDKQVLTLLLGAAALGLILNESKKRDRRATVTSRYDNGYVPSFRRDNGHDNDRDRYGRWDRSDRRTRLLPANCAYVLKGSDGRGEVLSSRCLADYGMLRGLPRECGLDVRGKYGKDHVYGVRCLRRNGFEIAEIRF